MAVEEIILRSVFDDQISDEVDGVIDNLKKFDAAAGAAAETFKDELAARVQGTVDTIVEFGGSIEDVRAAQERLRKATGTGARGLAQQANVLRTLTDESEDSAAALKNLDKALELAAASGLKAEDAGRELGKALKGDVAVLNTLDARAQAAAKAIEGITDPAKRTKLIMQELDRALKRQNGTLAKLQNSFKGIAASQPGLVSALKITGGAVAGLSAITMAFAGKAVKSFLEGSAKMRKAQERNSKALSRFSFQVGGVITKALGIDKAFSKTGGGISRLAATFDKHRLSIAKGIRGAAKLAFTLGEAVTFVVGGIAQAIAFGSDAIGAVMQMGKGAMSGLFSLLEKVLTFVNEIGQKVPSIGELVPLSFIEAARKTSIDLAKEAAKPFDFSATEAAVDATNAFNEMIKEGRNMLELDKELKAKDVSKKGIGRKTTKQGQEAAKAKREKAAQDEAARQSQARKDSLKAAQDEAAENARRARILKEQEIAKDRERFNRELEASQSAFDTFTKPIEQTRAALFALGVEGFGAVIDGAFNMVEALATGQLAIKDLGAAAASTVGSILFEQGQALAEAAIKQGAVFTLLGEAYAALASNPLALLGIGAALVGAGLALKAFAQPDKKRAASRGDTRAAAAIERLGRDLCQKQEQGREMIPMVGDRQMRGYVVDTANDAARRGQLAPAR